jgi:16S rRNA (cytidine1402-2'-O)-methyltransferase
MAPVNPSLPGTLYLIPTTLGESSLDVVLPEHVKHIAATLRTFIVEHPKTARHFLKLLGTEIPLQELRMLTLNEHTPPAQLTELLQPLLAGENVGLMSEAGCPAVADPGADLVRLAHQSGIKVVPLVGPSSILLALMASGLGGQRFTFHGYLPAESGARIQRLKELEAESRSKQQTQIFIETPYRNQQLLQAILETCGKNTRLCLATDITLADESIVTRTVAQWRGLQVDINKKPTVFLIHSGA